MTEDKAMLKQLFAGGGEMGALMRSLDWSQTLLGPVSGWTQSLKTALGIILNSRFPMFIWWGRELAALYNDAYRPMLGERKHPQFLGNSAKEMWSEIWDTVGPLTDTVLNTGQPTWSENLLLPMNRNGYLEEAYFTFSYSPVFDESGGVGGIFSAVSETTERIIGERRLRTLRELSANTAVAKTVESACHLATTTLEANDHDIPFALLYLVEPEGQQARLVGTTTNIEAGTIASPRQVNLTQETDGWHLAQVNHTGTALVVTNLTERFGALPGGAWSDSPDSALVMPIAQAGQKQHLAGLLIIGISPRREFDDGYRGFFDLVNNHIATAIANANAKEAEHKRAEALAELDRAKTAFFSNVSHEFRTPLTLMLSPLADMLANPKGPKESERKQLEMVQRNALRLLKLVNTLLDFSRIEAGRVQAVYEPTDLAMLTTDLAGVFRSAIERAGLRLLVDCPPLPEPVYVDRQMWEKIVLNLLSNAFKFTFEGEIAVNLHSRGDHMELEVRDTGTGIAESELPHLFERFHQVQGARGRTIEGSGIGLSLVQELVRLHGGSIHVTSVVDQGTCFTVSIPTGYAHLQSECIKATSSLASTATGATPYIEEALGWLPTVDTKSSKVLGSEHSLPVLMQTGQPLTPTARILVADDNADMRDYVKRMLNQQYEVEAVTDGVAALAAVRQQVPDLVLTDVMMPGLDGFGLLRELRANPDTQEIPIILLSARAGEESRIEGVVAGADDYLIKPFSARELLARVEASLKMARMRQSAANRERELRTISEAAQREAEAAYNQVNRLLESMSDAFTALDRDWRIIYHNAQAERINGKPRTEVLGKTVWDEWPASVGTNLERQYRRAMQEQVTVHFEHHYYLPPTYDIWFEIHVYPSEDGLGIFYRDITARKQAESALRQSEEWLRLAVEATQLGLWDFDPVQGLKLTTPSCCEILGLPVKPQYIYDDWARILHPEDRDQTEEVIRRALDPNGRGRYATEYRIVWPSGEVRWIRAYGLTTFRKEGSVRRAVRMTGTLLDITERKRTEEALRQSEHQLRLVADNVPVFIAYYDTERRYRFVNRRYAEFFGYRPQELIGKYIPELVGEEAYRSIREYIDTALSGQAIEFEVEVPFEAIGAQWRRMGYVPDFNERAEVRGLFAVVSDISDRKRAEIALQKSEAKFRAVFEQMYQFVGLLTPDGILLEVNQTMLTFANVEPEAVIGLSFWEFPSWKATAELQEIAKTAVAQAASGRFFHREVTIPDANGKPHTFDISVKPIHAPESDQIVWLSAEARDITTLVRLQDALFKEQQRSSKLINSSVDGIVAFDALGYCTLWNPAMEQLTGLRQEEVLSRLGTDVFSALAEAKTLQGFHPGTPETVTAFDFSFIHPKTRRYQWIEARYSPLHDGDNAPNGGLMIVRDVTKQRELERMQREFISIISHEIRTPLTSICGALGLLAADTLDDEPQTAREMLGIANNNIERLVRLVSDILALNRLDSGQVELKKQWCDAEALVQQAFSNVQPLAEANQIALHSSSPKIQVWADPDWLVQVLVNLINNAVKFSPVGTTVTVDVLPQPIQVLFRVKDQGRGIPTQKLENIFERFQQVDASDSRQQGGTGLGLAICRLIVQLHGGRIWAESELGHGSTFGFTLPIGATAKAVEPPQ